MFSKHALEKLDNYGIEIEEIGEIIKHGMKWREEKTGKWHANMAGLECVFIKEQGYVYVITIYEEGV